MRIPKGELTPALRAEIEALHAMTLGGREGDGRTRYSVHARNAMIWGAWSAALAILLAGVLMADGAGSVSAEVALGIVLAFVLTALPTAFYARSRAGYTPDELRAYLPRLDLSPPERLFAGTLALAYESDDPFLREEALPALRSLCAEWARLDTIAATLASGGPREGEVEGLRARLARTEDPLAREALAQSLATAERRATASLGERAARERLEAHRETIAQSAHAIAETAARSRPGLTVSAGEAGEAGELADLRAAVSRATGDVAALEAAVQEMRSL